MTAKDLISPYLNRFVALLHQNSTAKVELTCKVNIQHDFGLIEEVAPEPEKESRKPLYKEVLRKNINNSRYNRLYRRANSQAEEARVELKAQQKIAENAKAECEISKIDAEKAKDEAKKAKEEAEKAKHEAAKVI